MRELSREQSLELFYDVMGYDKNFEPSLDQMDERGFSPDWREQLSRLAADAQ